MTDEAAALSLTFRNGQTVMLVGQQELATKAEALKLSEEIKRWAANLSEKKPRAPRAKPVVKAKATRPSRSRAASAAGDAQAATPSAS